MSTSAGTSRRRRPQFSIRSLLLLVTDCCLALFAWEKAQWQAKKWVAEQWVQSLLHQVDRVPLGQDQVAVAGVSAGQLPACPRSLDKREQLDVLRLGVSSLTTKRQRTA